MTNPYFPDRALISSRNSQNRRRAMCHPYAVPPAFADADTDELFWKFERQTTPDGETRCYLCGHAVHGDHEWHLEHVHPLALGGTHQTDNLEIACVTCNLTKRDLALEDFIGEELAGEWRRNGWPPPFSRLSSQPVEELWSRSPTVARKFARHPREVPVSTTSEWSGPWAKDWRIAVVLSSQSDPWRAIPIKDLAPILDEGPGPLDQAWTNAMGMMTVPSKPWYHDLRYPPSSLVVPTRARPRGRTRLVGVKAFRLRFDVENVPQRSLQPDPDTQFDQTDRATSPGSTERP